MPVCANCGQGNPARARFCMSCASPLTQEEPAPHGARKTVTVVFCDVAGFTPLAELLDPESMREVMTRFFGAMRRALERHGGTVEKFIGDAVMAVFGVPFLHEDDAIRAVRAAQAMREELAALNTDLRVRFGVQVETRIGVNTGEVVVGDSTIGQALVVGDAVNIAARLEQAAGAGDILLGPATYALVRDDVVVEPTEPLSLKGKSESLVAHRLLSIGPGTDRVRSRPDPPLVARDLELGTLRTSFDRAVAGRTSVLVTVLGPAGIGKSRLAREFAGRVGSNALLLRGRCLPYGDGITFWPVANVVRQVSGITDADDRSKARSKIEAVMHGCADGTLVAERVAGVTGVGSSVAGLQETFWAIRRFLEWTGRDRPLLLILDDLQWAEPTMLDLVEYLAARSRNVATMLLCLARPDLMDMRPTWASDVASASVLSLDPLDANESHRFVNELLGGVNLDDEAFALIAEPAAGNPLFLEEMLRMLDDDGLLVQEGDRRVATLDLGELRVPDSIHALLGARLDRLSQEERLVIRSASVVGKGFWRDAIEELAPESVRVHVGSALDTLVRKDLIRPDPSTLAGEDSFRFHHILIQETAYRGTPKQVRAELHEAFAVWLEGTAGDRFVELEEVIGYHLEQAYRYRSELSPPTEREQTLATRAGLRLAPAGIRAFERRDIPAAIDLLGRARALLPREHPDRLGTLIALGEALEEAGDLAPALAAFDEAELTAKEADDQVAAANATILRLFLSEMTDPGTSSETLDQARGLIATLERSGDDRGLARAWILIGNLHWDHARYGDADEAIARAIEHAHRAGATGEEFDALGRYTGTGTYGPAPTKEIERRCRELLDRSEGTGYEAPALRALAWVRAMQGQFDEARELVGRSRAILEDLGLRLRSTFVCETAAEIEMLAGEPAAAEREIRAGLDAAVEMGEQSFQATLSAALAHALIEQGRADEAEEMVSASEIAAAEDDVSTQVLGRSARARIEASRGLFKDGERLARDAVALSESTDDLNMRGDTLVDLAMVLVAGGDGEGAAAAFDAALELYRAKGNIAAEASTRRAMEAAVGQD
ncbi:MAG TPA: adenylate/guanylate cyclase domain-containing protein [Actinomycetota bacterium]|nr:adenylate/guanylate cyclase domain-containing protein [Actinomycetota bacterium]